MELIERAEFLELLETRLAKVTQGEGHCVFVSGEAGIGKTSLVKTFARSLKKEYRIFQGTCDALFTPRPLAPLYDILLQSKSDLWKSSTGIEERAALFTNFFHELANQKEPTLIIFEDIHWADEATLDLHNCPAFLFLPTVIMKFIRSTR
jgi:predicted ATPase